SQCLIQPPQDRPYFLLLQGYGKEDFVLYVVTRPQHIFGRPERRGGPEKSGGGPETPPPTPETPEAPPKSDLGPFSVVDTFLSAPDILPRHCLVQASPGGGDPNGDPPSATVRPFRGAPATLNGSPLLRRAPLNPGDLLGLGEHVLLLYKDPRIGDGAAGGGRPPWVPPPRASLGILGVLGCAGCGRSPQERREALRGALETPKAELRYRPQDEGTLLRDILNMDFGAGPGRDLGEGSPGEDLGDSGGDSGEDLGGLAPAFLLGLCLDHAAREFPPGHFPELLGRGGRRGDPSESPRPQIPPQFLGSPPSPPDGDPPPALDLAGVTSDLRPLLLWLANAVELLNLAQGHLQAMERELDIEGPCPELEQDLESCDEALGVLDEVIMFTFQQSVYYLTKKFPHRNPPPKSKNSQKVFPKNPAPPKKLKNPKILKKNSKKNHSLKNSQNNSQTFSNSAGSAGPFFQWWVGVRVRTNLDLVLDGLAALGLGDIAGDFFRKLSATANLLCTPRGCLEQ
ncbi:RAIN protein, partial [Dasyornis broadbenti]|nr:RAIN protein [Dasyornis broadbenti]